VAAPEQSDVVPTIRSPAAGCLNAVLRLAGSAFAAFLTYLVADAAFGWISTAIGNLMGLLFAAAVFAVVLSYTTRAFPPPSRQPAQLLSHWYTMIEGLSISPREFYGLLVEALKERSVPGLDTSFAYARERGPLSARRLYLEVRRENHVFHVCGAPFANGFFVSWWMGELRGILFLLVSLMPLAETFFPWFLRPRTYYEIDTALMFQTLTHSALLEVVDGITTAKGIRGIAEAERKPIMRDFLVS
jgi:hypothetical protein